MQITELTAVNALLAAVGIRPLTAQDTNHPSYLDAQTTLINTMNDVQAMSWWFNDRLATFTPDAVDGTIRLPDSVIQIRTTNRDLIQRGRILYNRKTNSQYFTAPVCVEIRESFSFEDLPYSAQAAIRDKAIVKYYTNKGGDAARTQVYMVDESKSWKQLEKDELRNRPQNALQSPSANMMRYSNMNWGVNGFGHKE